MTPVQRQWLMLAVLALAILQVIVADIWTARTDLEATYSRMAARAYIARPISVLVIIGGLCILIGHLLFPQYLVRERPCPRCPHCQAAARGVTERTNHGDADRS